VGSDDLRGALFVIYLISAHSRNKKDERGIVVKNKARLVAQGNSQEEGIDYDEVFAPVAKTEAIRLFLAYASFKDFVVYQMDVKSAFLYEKIEEEVYIYQPHGFEDPNFPDKVYKVEKALDGLHQAPRACQDKYMADILKKFDFSTVKTPSTPMEPNKALVKNAEAEDVDVHLYRSMIGTLMYLTASRPDITFAICACARDSPFDLEAYSDSDYAGASLDKKSTTGEYVAAANCYGQVLWIQNQIVENKESLIPTQMLDYGFNFLNIKIYIDNGSTNCIVENPVFHSKTKHIEIRHHFIRDSYEKKLIQVIKIHTDQNVAVGQINISKALYKISINFVTHTFSPNQTYPTSHSTFSINNGYFEVFDTYNMIAYLKKTKGSEGFHQIVNFLNSSHIKFALTENPTIYTLLIQQFWQTAVANTLDTREIQITATIDRNVKLIYEASIRRHLKLEDSDGISTLPNTKLFEQLALMGNIATAIICPATNETFNFSKMIFEGMGEGSTVPVESHHIPLGDLTISQPRHSSPSRVPTTPYDSPLPGGHTPGSDEGSLTLNELTVLWRMIEDIDQGTGVILVTLTKVSSQEDQPEDQLRVLSAAKILADATRIHTYSRRRRAVSSGSGRVSTASRIISAAEETVSTAGVSMTVSTAGMVQEVLLHQEQQKIRDEEENQRIAKAEEIAQRLQEEIDATERQNGSKIKELFEATMRRIQDFVPMKREGDKEVSKFTGAGGLKRDAEEELDQGSSKKQKTDEASGSV
nr:putative reverse transcriptase, RNA-dependent DNA polymerase [Tanacetum cinerariifolium]